MYKIATMPVELVLPKADQALLGNMEDALLIQVGVLGSNLVPKHTNWIFGQHECGIYPVFVILLSPKEK